MSDSHNKGSITLIIGNNGTGKTTLVKKMVRQDPSVSYLPQQIEYLSNLTVRDYLDLSVCKGSFDDIKERLKIDVLMEKEMGILSGGELKRVALYSSILKNAQHVILDEPFEHFDADFKSILKNILVTMKKQGKRITIVSHDFYWLGEIVDKVKGFHNSKLIEGSFTSDFFSLCLGYTFINVGNTIMPKVEKVCDDT